MIMVTSNAQELAARAAAAGAKVTKGRDSHLFFITDPDNYRIEVFQP